MKTSLAAAALAILVPLKAGAVVTAKGDPNKWDPATERNAPSQWVSTQIGDDVYIAFMPPAPLWKTPAYAPKAKGAKMSTPLFKVGAVAQGAEDPKKKGSQVWTVATEKSNYRLDFGTPGTPYIVACVQAATGCPPKDVPMPSALDSESGGFKGIPTNQSNVVLRVSPPGAAATTTTAADGGDKTTTVAAQDSREPGPWEKIALASIASISEDQKRDFAKDPTPNKKTREALIASLPNYLKAAEDRKAQPLGQTEIDYIKARLQAANADSAAFEAAAKWPDPASADAQKFAARWRGVIVAEVKEYLARGEEQQVGFNGSTTVLTDARKQDVNAAQTPGSPLEAKLASFHPGQGSRRDGAQRAVIAAFIENQQGDKKFKQIKEDLMAGKTPSMSWDAMLAAAMRWVPAQIKDPKTAALANVPKETLLDAYCDPNQTTGSAAPRSTTASAMSQARGVAKDAKTAATGGSVEDSGTGGRVTDGAGTAAVDPLQGECSKRLAAVRGLVPDAPVKPVGDLAGGTIVPAPTGGTGGVTGDKFKGNGDIGKNEKDDPAAGKDSKMGDHIRVGAAVGLFMGLMGLVGGPVGLLVLGAVGFGIGFGIDKMTNKG